jgi:hypothetical protein
MYSLILWEEPRAGVDLTENRDILVPSRNQTPAVRLLASHFSDVRYIQGSDSIPNICRVSRGPTFCCDASLLARLGYGPVKMTERQLVPHVLLTLFSWSPGFRSNHGQVSGVFTEQLMPNWKTHETTQIYVKYIKIFSVRCANISALNFLKLRIFIGRKKWKGASRSFLSGSY